MFQKTKSFFFKAISQPARLLMKWQFKDISFCIISNDCYGGELYRILNRPYNTPFIGLMMMAPCYLRMLQNLEYYISLEPRLIESSKYPEMNSFRASRNHYPLAVLDDIEIHFLHYSSSKEAIETWKRRTQRMDMQHVCIKFALDKDYAEDAHLHLFEKLPFSKKLSIGKLKRGDAFKSYIQIPQLAFDAAQAFRQSLAFADIVSWIKEGKPHFSNKTRKILGWFFAVSFRNAQSTT